MTSSDETTDPGDLPDPLPPLVWCDFMAWGWSDEPGDDRYYVLQLGSTNAVEGLRVLLWDDDQVIDGEEHVLARVARLERYEDGHGQPAWCARPFGKFHRGVRPW